MCVRLGPKPSALAFLSVSRALYFEPTQCSVSHSKGTSLPTQITSVNAREKFEERQLAYCRRTGHKAVCYTQNRRLINKLFNFILGDRIHTRAKSSFSFKFINKNFHEYKILFAYFDCLRTFILLLFFYFI